MTTGVFRSDPLLPPLIVRAMIFALRTVLPTTRWGDRNFALMEYMLWMRRIPRVRNPARFNERLLKMKLDGSLFDPLRQYITDKEYAKQYIAAVVGGAHTPRTIAVLRSDSEIDRFVPNDLPCVFKPTHLSGGQVLFQLDSNSNVDRRTLKKWLRRGWYRRTREGNYRYLERKIIVEEYFSGPEGRVPRDYKVFCFHGCPKLIEVDSGRFVKQTRNFYDTSWNRLKLTVKHPAGVEDDARPRHLELMLELARRLSEPFSSIRVDMYASDTDVKVGELTNCHGGGHELIQPDAAELWLGDLFEDGQQPALWTR